MTNHTKLAIRDKLEKLTLIAADRSGEVITAKVSTNLRGLTAGRANWRTREIRLNAELLESHPEQIINQTLGHEYAHIVSKTIYGPNIQSHGREWARVMRWFNLEPRRCHNLPAKRARATKYVLAACDCRQHKLSSIRLNRMRRNGATYQCIYCRTNVKPLGSAA